MAKQVGNIKIGSQRIGRLVFYKMGNEYYVRTKSSLTGKRVKKDPKFRRSMKSAGRLARASKIASAVYKALPANFRIFSLYRSFTGEAIMMLKQGMKEEEVLVKLLEVYVPKFETKNEEAPLKKKIVNIQTIENNVFPFLVRELKEIKKFGYSSQPKIFRIKKESDIIFKSCFSGSNAPPKIMLSLPLCLSCSPDKH